ncbi:MAG: histidine phosphatase family protein [Eubacterium sp.]|nr:histidine phosphatase family protein [Eubacterium sp.]
MWNRTENQVTGCGKLVLIRHGATQANKEHRYLGKTDEALLESTRVLLSQRKAKGFYPQVQCLFTSPMKRCIQTAGVLYPHLRPLVIPEWEETDFGRFEYKNYEELKTDAQYQAWIDSGGTLDFPGGESRADFLLRCESGWVRMWKLWSQSLPEQEKGQAAAPPASAAAVVHGGTIMALLSIYGNKQYFDCQAANGRGYVCRLAGWGSRAWIREAVPL